MSLQTPPIEPSLQTPRPQIEKSFCGFVELDDKPFYRIADSDRLPPFLMNIVSGSNHWIFVSSNGALTAGRKDADNALFPYCTQDKLFESANTVGSSTLIWVEAKNGSAVFWEPFCSDYCKDRIQRNLYKSIDGNKIIFEEVHLELEVAFRYSWETSERFGFVKKATVENFGDNCSCIRLLDGIQNLVPYGLNQTFLNLYSNLADAYKKNELLEAERLGIFYLSSIPTDRAEPSEGLRATVAWSLGIDAKTVLLSPTQVEIFREGGEIELEPETRGLRCAYFVESTFQVPSKGKKDWWIVADINQDAKQVEGLRVQLGDQGKLCAELLNDIRKNDEKLRKKVGLSDGFQLTSDRLRDARHHSNTLFNIMRGGIFDCGYEIDVLDLISYLRTWNGDVSERHEIALNGLGRTISHSDLIDWAMDSSDRDLVRLVTEYLPLSFSRRHGDPSRPWNQFSIETQDEEGNPILTYQGNWRDIFQNWEPLAYSFPDFIEGMISRFLNSSTADGYNPYRVTRDGFDWEILDSDEAWSNIGYWGDHQIIYLLKLLEALDKHKPEALQALLSQENFVFAHVPYRIKGFSKIWENPRDTVDYDDKAAYEIANREKSVGADDKLLRTSSGNIVRANLTEKLFAPLLAKMSNFVPDGGIWMNTQRPEWNDANNALVGYGVSVVTLCYVYRYLQFLDSQLANLEATNAVLFDRYLAEFLEDQLACLEEKEKLINDEFAAAERFAMLESLGIAGENFRNSVYESRFGLERIGVSVTKLRSYVSHALKFVGRSIDSNERSDGMFNSYNLLRPIGGRGVEIDNLSEMLEGQVAALSSNRLTPRKAVELLDSLRSSALYREDVESYILYPDRELPRFLEKNRVSEDKIAQSELLKSMIGRGDERIIAKDVSGGFRFNGDFRNSLDVARAISDIRVDYSAVVDAEEEKKLLSIFDDTFNHRSFTGRSGTFFAYEGLGSVYWHMVSKLLLAIQENYYKECCCGNCSDVLDSLASHYFATLNGLGFDKTPMQYGAFPTDAYSHTPKHAGVQQPGMTGQVKEDILSRWGELGVFVEKGVVSFKPLLLRKSEFLKEEKVFDYIGQDGVVSSERIPTGCIAFTYCQTLIRYSLGNEPGVVVHMGNGEIVRRTGFSLSKEESRVLFARNGSILSIEVNLPEGVLIDR
ncbi:hypothetical protein MLD52_15940 [Puniceicoccaceae bacterium K14]|nr:hypothetical protein [Puniceicoccaceae bacterium K14]